MANYSEIQVNCPSCGQQHKVRIYPSINVAETPELREKVCSGEVFTAECPHCGHRQILKYDMLYHDPEAKVLVCLTDSVFHSDGMEGYNCRLVSDVSSLMEKVKIFSAGLDDLVIELCKYVTLREMGKDVNLRFLRMDGADQSIIMAYPQNGQMEMLEIGFNVYEDCAGIVNRNPALRDAASGLVTLDQNWISRFF